MTSLKVARQQVAEPGRVSTVTLVYTPTLYCHWCFYMFNASLWMQNKQKRERDERREGKKEGILQIHKPKNINDSQINLDLNFITTIIIM